MEPHELADGGILLHKPAFLAAGLADRYFTTLRDETPWEQKIGRFRRPQPRLTASFGDDGVAYRYSGTVNPALPWTPLLLEVRERIQAVQGHYNFCLLNRYRSGADSVGLHSDDEPEMGDTIASLSLGAPRTFRLRHNRTKQCLSFELGNGTLLIMAGTTQTFWKHEVPKSASPVGERISLTFRQLEMQAAPGRSRGRTESSRAHQSERLAR